jgi:hypothetical protein
LMERFGFGKIGDGTKISGLSLHHLLLIRCLFDLKPGNQKRSNKSPIKEINQFL